MQNAEEDAHVSYAYPNKALHCPLVRPYRESRSIVISQEGRGEDVNRLDSAGYSLRCVELIRIFVCIFTHCLRYFCVKHNRLSAKIKVRIENESHLRHYTKS